MELRVAPGSRSRRHLNPQHARLHYDVLIAHETQSSGGYQIQMYGEVVVFILD
jgi:hypothetical protein